MKKKQRTYNLDLSRHPSRDGVSKVYFANPDVYSSFGKDITKEQFINSMSTYNRILDLEKKKVLLKETLMYVCLSIPFFVFIFNIFIQPLLR